MGAGTKTIDAGGRLLVPGFNDAHAHLATVGAVPDGADFRSVSDEGQFVEALAKHLATLPSRA
ncbi:MAG: amidohydrolase family protein [Planctomycetes bacterium]|nr:amidohydrolase family protein [Planctomycetota bacterium]